MQKPNQVYKNGKLEYFLKGYYFFFPFFFLSDEHGIVLIYSIHVLDILFSHQCFSVFWNLHGYSYLGRSFITWPEIYVFFFEGVSFFRHALNVIKWSAGTLHLIIHSTSYILRHTIIFYILMSVKEKYLLSGDGNLSLSNFYWMSFEIWS